MTLPMLTVVRLEHISHLIPPPIVKAAGMFSVTILASPSVFTSPPKVVQDGRLTEVTIGSINIKSPPMEASVGHSKDDNWFPLMVIELATDWSEVRVKDVTPVLSKVNVPDPLMALSDPRLSDVSNGQNSISNESVTETNEPKPNDVRTEPFVSTKSAMEVTEFPVTEVSVDSLSKLMILAAPTIGNDTVNNPVRLPLSEKLNVLRLVTPKVNPNFDSSGNAAGVQNLAGGGGPPPLAI